MKSLRDSDGGSWVPIATVGVLAVSWALPLAWPTLMMSAATLTALAGGVLWRSVRRSGWQAAIGRTVTAASCCLAGIGLISVGYAAFALTHAGSFGPVTRLGYPFLVGTGLRLPGGACLLALCGLVSLVPLLFRNQERVSPARALEAHKE